MPKAGVKKSEPAAKPVFQVPVRELVEFALRRGDLGGERDFAGPHRALAGIRGHQKIQRSRPAGYQKEVPLTFEVEAEDLILRVQGRVDGLLAAGGSEVVLEEIKTVQGAWDGQAEAQHWAQTKVYGFIYARQHGLEKIALRLTYLELETGRIQEFGETFLLAELASLFNEAAGIYIDWLRERDEWRRRRDESIRSLAFPFGQYRPGQREAAVAAYRALAGGGRLFLEAPTGIGKTIATLFPAIKAVGEGKLERIWYLTARTVGRAVAAKAFGDLRAGGLRLRTLALTAKETICVQAGQPCDARACPLARGYYDRRRAAMRAALGLEQIDRAALEAVARDHQVCPFELSLDLSMWVDAVVCDYNYVFDPKVYLRRHFAEEPGDFGFLIDEAHNLVDRARDMFSADLNSGEIHQVRRQIKAALPGCAKALARLARALRQLAGSGGAEPGDPSNPATELDLFGNVPEPSLQSAPDPGPSALRALPEAFVERVEEAMEAAEAWLARNEPSDFREDLLGLYFRLHAFCRTAELYDERFVTLIQPGDSTRVRLYCLDPSFLLRQALARGKAAVFFSATLSPLDYYRDLLGGGSEDPVVRLPSPFPPENLAVLVQDRIRTDFKARAGTLAQVARAIDGVVRGRRGNYLVYFPSYAYLEAVRQEFEGLGRPGRIVAQRPGLSEAEREAFLAAFTAEHQETLVGFAVMGGMFGEGIDLVGDRLIGAVIVGVGLPQICAERDLIKNYFEQKAGAGFEYAYTFPGMNRVLQATGRVIRAETDRGVVALIDTRFGEGRYRRLFPEWWRPARVGSLEEIAQAVDRFWAGVCP